MSIEPEMSTIWDVFDNTDWGLLAAQKLALVDVLSSDILSPRAQLLMEGIVEFLDHIQDSAADSGYEVYRDELPLNLGVDGSEFMDEGE